MLASLYKYCVAIWSSNYENTKDNLVSGCDDINSKNRHFWPSIFFALRVTERSQLPLLGSPYSPHPPPLSSPYHHHHHIPFNGPPTLHHHGPPYHNSPTRELAGPPYQNSPTREQHGGPPYQSGSPSREQLDGGSYEHFQEGTPR